jgi:predicted DNA binding CopG/RHH family protein
MRGRKPKTTDKRPIPTFTNEAEERRFWEAHDTTPYIDWKRGRRLILPNLKPSTTTISLRLPAPLLAELKVLANMRDVPYQSLLKVFLADRVSAERRAGALPNRRSIKPSGRVQSTNK